MTSTRKPTPTLDLGARTRRAYASTLATVTLAICTRAAYFSSTCPQGIGIVGGVLEVIPYLGGIIALTLGILSALTISPALAVWVLVAYVAVSTIEGHLVAPFLYGRALGLRSVVVLVALFVGGKAAGVLGIFFAVPVAVILTAIVQEVQAEIFKET